MADINFYQDWLTSALFWLGFCITIFGTFLLLAPASAIKFSDKVNRSISTDSFFQKLDKPHYQERLFYRRHRLFGSVLVAASIYIFYMMLFKTNMNSIAQQLPIFRETIINEWLYEAIQYFLVGVSVLIAIAGIAIFVRPSVLKTIEEKANYWHQTNKSLEKLDTNYDIPQNILPGNVRLFGVLVSLGGIYIMAGTFGLIF